MKETMMESTTPPRTRRPLRAKAQTLPSEVATAIPQGRTPQDLLAQAEDISAQWRGIVDGLLEISLQNPERPRPEHSLPEWATRWIGRTLKEHRATSDQHRHLMAMAGEAIRMMEGLGTSRVWEVWTEPNRRLSIRHESYAAAAAALDRLDKTKFPRAFVVNIPIRPFVHEVKDLQLLDTLLGRITWAGTVFDHAEYLHMIQDETGRSLTVPLDILVEHPVFAQMDQVDRDQILAQQAQKARRKAEREAAQP